MKQRFSAEGALVISVVKESPASHACLKPVDVIERIKLAAKQKHSVVLLRIDDRGDKRFVAVKLASA